MLELGAVDLSLDTVTLNLPEHQPEDVLQLGECANCTPSFRTYTMSVHY